MYFRGLLFVCCVHVVREKRFMCMCFRHHCLPFSMFRERWTPKFSIFFDHVPKACVTNIQLREIYWFPSDLIKKQTKDNWETNWEYWASEWEREQDREYFLSEPKFFQSGEGQRNQQKIIHFIDYCETHTPLYIPYLSHRTYTDTLKRNDVLHHFTQLFHTYYKAIFNLCCCFLLFFFSRIISTQNREIGFMPNILAPHARRIDFFCFAKAYCSYKWFKDIINKIYSNWWVNCAYFIQRKKNRRDGNRKTMLHSNELISSPSPSYWTVFVCMD